jgi:hypothetical protein
MGLDIKLIKPMPTSVYDAHITHNLVEMAEHVKIELPKKFTMGDATQQVTLYNLLWRPHEIGITRAEELICPLVQALASLRTKPAYYKNFDPMNYWGSYKTLVDFVIDYVIACKKHPDARIEVDR